MNRAEFHERYEDDAAGNHVRVDRWGGLHGKSAEDIARPPTRPDQELDQRLRDAHPRALEDLRQCHADGPQRSRARSSPTPSCESCWVTRWRFSLAIRMLMIGGAPELVIVAAKLTASGSYLGSKLRVYEANCVVEIHRRTSSSPSRSSGMPARRASSSDYPARSRRLSNTARPSSRACGSNPTEMATGDGPAVRVSVGSESGHARR